MRAPEVLTADLKHDEILRRCDDRKLLRQISKAEISELIKFFLSPESQGRLATLSLGVCTRFDKRTLAASNRPFPGALTIAFDTFYKQEPQIPRTIIAMRKTETVTVAYILLGSKLAEAYSINKFRASKNPLLKTSGSYKQKTNVLKISLSDNLDEIDVSLKAILKVKKKIKNYMFLLNLSSHSAVMQHTLAQHCSEILDCTPLVLDNTFTDRNLYIEAELGVELFDIVAKKRLEDPQDQLIAAKDICAAICFMHRLNFPHRDVKLENLIVVNGSKRPKFIDFDFMDEPGKSEEDAGTLEYMPYYFLGLPQYKEFRTSKYNVSNLVLNETERSALYKACRSGVSFCDIWAFGITLYMLYTGHELDSSKGKSSINSYKNSSKVIEQVIYQIICPERKNCYLFATQQQLEQDWAKPLAERTYLSMEKLYHMLFAEEYKLDEEIVKELQPRIRHLIATKPKLRDY